MGKREEREIDRDRERDRDRETERDREKERKCKINLVTCKGGATVSNSGADD